MDIRFLAVIFLVVALMEMLAKMARKRRGEEEGLEEEIEPRRPADPLAGVLEEMQRLTRGDEGGREVVPEVDDRRIRAREVASRAPELQWELEVPVQPDPLPERPAMDSVAPLPTSERAPEPVTLRGQIEKMFEPMPRPPTVPVVVPEPPPQPKPVVPRRDGSSRPVEARPRETRPREARDISERAWAVERDVSTDAPKTADDVGRRVETRWGGEAGGGPGLGSVRDLRRLVVAREVLGPPLSLRSGEPFTER